jgi:hypothetical protein
MFVRGVGDLISMCDFPSGKVLRPRPVGRSTIQ